MQDDRWTIREGGILYTTALKGPRPSGGVGRYQRFHVEADGYPRGPSLAYEVAPCEEACANSDSALYMQKLNHHFLYSGQPRMGVGLTETKWLGFAMRVTGDLPDENVILFQMWQGSPFGPPFAAVLRADSRLSFQVRNAETGSNPSAQPTEIGSTAITYGQWYQFKIGVTPDPLGRLGDQLDLKMKVAGGAWQQVVLYTGALGYSDRDSCHYAGRCDLGRYPNDTLDFKFGVYRRADATRLKVQFDNIKLGELARHVDPDIDCLL